MWSKLSFFASTLFGHGDADLVHIEGTHSWELFSLHLYLFIDVYAFRCCCCYFLWSKIDMQNGMSHTPCLTSHSKAATSFSSFARYSTRIQWQSGPIAKNDIDAWDALTTQRSRSHGQQLPNAFHQADAIL